MAGFFVSADETCVALGDPAGLTPGSQPPHSHSGVVLEAPVRFKRDGSEELGSSG